MSRLDEAVALRLATIREMVSSGATEMTGHTKRDEATGKIVGRFAGGMSVMFPELARAGVPPGQAAAAIERGKGRVFRRLEREAREELSPYVREVRRSAGRPTVPAHPALTSRCRHCGGLHTTSQHRSHGAGAFHQTHLFSFNPMGPTKIYDQTLAIVARKGKGHPCDAKCKRANHTYIHRFKRSSSTPIFGSSDRRMLMIGAPRVVANPAKGKRPKRRARG